jgi:hypothetical protein
VTRWGGDPVTPQRICSTDRTSVTLADRGGNVQKLNGDPGVAHPFVATCVLVVAASACHAQVKGSATASASETQVEDERKWEVAEAPSPPQDAPPPGAAAHAAPRVAAAVATAPAPVSNVGFLGVVHDLSLSSSAPRSPVCRCLALAYGPPSDAKFSWQAGPLAGDHETVAIAIAVDGVACPSGPPPARMSIAAVEREGTDIVLVLETVGQGRPIMRGALAAWPGPNGAIVVRTRRDAHYPDASGTGPCRVALK